MFGLDEIEVLLDRVILAHVKHLEETLSTVVSDLTDEVREYRADVDAFTTKVSAKLAEVEALLRSNTDHIDPAALQPLIGELRADIDAVNASTAAVAADTTGDTPAPEPAPDTPPADGTTV